MVNRNNLGILLRGGLKVEIRAGVNKPPKEYRHILNLEIAIQACWKREDSSKEKKFSSNEKKPPGIAFRVTILWVGMGLTMASWVSLYLPFLDLYFL